MKVGQAAKLIFEIESEDEDGTIERDYERMWVVVSEIVAPYFIGRLTNQPVRVTDDSLFYLKEGVEVPFLPDHIIDIDQPTEAFVSDLLSQKPKYVWSRE